MFVKSLIVTFNFILSVVFFSSCVSSSQESTDKPIPLDELTIAEIHQAYTQGIYNSQDLVDAYIKAIEEKNGSINAITIVNPEAMAIAEFLDLEYARTKKLRPLHGIPIIVKDNINTVGLPTTAGASALKDIIPEQNAFIIDRFVDAGAIVLAKSNMAEWAFSPMHTTSTLGGTTRNPYNLDFVPAGSSGGTAAAIASNIGVGGLGTDTGNSIRGPSSHCALVGFRTTIGLISREGIVPLFLRNDVVGPMCRTVEDATRMMEVMVGIDTLDQVTFNSKDRTSENYIQYLQKDGLKGARIGVFRQVSDIEIDEEVKHLFEQALADMDALGAKIIDPVWVPDFESLSEGNWCSVFRKDVEKFLQDYVKNDSIQTLEDIIRIGTSAPISKQRLEAYASKEGRWGKGDSACLDAYHDEKRIAFRMAIESMMDSLKLDAIVYPSWNQKPARIAYFEEQYGGDNNQIISPHTGQPAFTVPMGMSAGNLPAGLQFLGRMYDEPTLIKLSYAYEQGTKHRKTPVPQSLAQQ
ncbi:amidase [Reichenbachiella sp.]|uniref:amidase n=1 Tax=Reichenbachiella sp. TaxID=2184521 RepID=UPI003B5C39EF